MRSSAPGAERAVGTPTRSDDRPPFDVRLVGPDDHGIHRELLVERLPHEDIDARLAWIYAGNPAGRALCWIAYDAASGDAAGMTTFFRRKMWVHGRPLAGALGGDMYVRPRFRRRGIGAALFRQAHAEMPAHGIDLMFGTPMRPNVTALSSSGSSVPEGAVVRYARLVRASARRLAKVPWPVGRVLDRVLAERARDGVRLEPVTGVDPRIDRIWAETRDELDIATVRDAEFYAWRFVRSPSRRQRPYVITDHGRPIAACALETIEEKLRIVDLVAPAARWPAALSAIAASVADETGVEIRLATGDAKRRGLWTSRFFPRDTDPMSMLNPAGSPLVATTHDPARWFITWADTDIDHV